MAPLQEISHQSRALTWRILLCSVLLIGLSFWCYEPLDPDLGWHLLGGNYVLETGSVPRADFINLFRTNWHDYHWLAQTILAGVYSIGGFPLLMFFNGSLVGCLSITIFLIASRSAHSPYLTLVLWAFAFGTVAPIISIRPQVFALFGVALAVLTMERVSLSRALPRLVCLTVLVSNMHVYWIFIPVVWGVYACVPRILGGTSFGQLLPWCGVFLLALSGLLSPYTFENGEFVPAAYSLLLDYLSTPPILHRTISEFKSSFAAGWKEVLLLLIFVAYVSATLTRKVLTENKKECCLAVLGFLLSCFQIKFLPFLGIFGLPLLKRIPPPSVNFVSTNYFFSRSPAVTLTTAALCGACISFPGIVYNEANLKLIYPITSCEFLAQNNAVRVLTTFDHGGWCKFSADRAVPGNQLKVTADGRTQQLPAEYFEKLFGLFTISPGWNVTLDSWGPEYAVLGKESSLAQVLGFAKGSWSVVFEEHNFVVFKRV